MNVRLRSMPVPFDAATLFSQSARFTLLSELGRGGSAVVYQVEDKERGEPVALKLSLRKDARTREGLSSELAIAREVPHPNLVRVYEVGQLEDRPYLLMELVEGVSLARYVHETGRLDEARLRACLVQLLSAVHALHAAQRVHRDVKPGNVRVTPAGRLVLLDLGIAGERGDLVWSEPGVGTPSYMAPEQVTGGIVGPPADLYAVGVMLFELLTGGLPHPEAAHGQTQGKLVAEAPRVRSQRPDAPEDLDSLCADLLARDPENRPDAGLVLKQLGHPVQDFSRRMALHEPEVLAGREGLLSAIARTLELAQRSGHFLVLEGPEGRGKRALVRALGPLLSDRARLFEARFHERPRSAFDGLDALMMTLVEYAGKVGPFDRLPSLRYVAWLGQMFPPLRYARCFGDARPEEVPVPDLAVRRRRALDLLRELVEALARLRPLVVCLDQFERAPPDARVVLSEAFMGVPGVLLVATGLPEHHALPCALDRRLVPPLGEDALVAILDEQWLHATGDVAPDVLPMAQRAAGEPWAALELARASLRGLPAEDAEAALHARLDALPRNAQHMLAVLAVADRELPQHLWLEVSGLEEREFHRQLFMLLESALITRVADWLAPSFALVHRPERRVLLARLSPAARRELHRDLSVASARHGELSEDERCVHLEAAGLSNEAARGLDRLCHDAEARLGFHHAAALYERWLVHEPARDKHGQERLRRLGCMLLAAGRPAAASEAFGRAIAFGSPTDAIELSHLRAEALLRSGHIEAGMAASHAALRDLGLDVPRSERRAALDLVWHRTVLSVRGTGFRPRGRRSFSPYELTRIDTLLGVSLRASTFDAVRGAELQVRALRLALEQREPLRVARAILLHVTQLAVDEPEPHARCFALLEEARALAQGQGDAALSALLDLVEGGVNLFDMQPARALVLCLDAEQRLSDTCQDESAALWLARLYAMSAASITGNLPVLQKLTQRALTEARDRGDVLLENLVQLRGLTHLALWARGAGDEAEALVARAMTGWPAQPPYLQHYFALLTRSLIAEHRVEPGLVFSHDQRVKALSRALFMHARAPRLSLDSARASLLGIEASLARGHGQREWIHELDRATTSFARGRSAMCHYHALLHRPAERFLAGDPAGSVRALVRLRDYAQDRELMLARAQAELALAHLEGGDGSAARREAALGTLRVLGVERAERMLGLLLPGAS